jgi:hypothetical protein
MLVSSGRRGFAILWAVLQFALPGVVTILDGAIALRERASVVAHVEETSSKTCQPPHSTECGICRYLSAGGLNDGGAGEPNWPLAGPALVPDGVPGLSASLAASRSRARAPPLA